MNWLLWREYRANGLVLIAGAALFLLPYLFLLGISLWKDMSIRGAMPLGAVFSYCLSPLVIAFLGGNAFAGERADRSAEFLGYLPVSRTRRLVSKLILAGIVMVLVWGMNLAVFRMLKGVFPWQLALEEGFLVVPQYIAITGLVMFGVGWGISSLQASPTFATCGGIITPFVILAGISIVAITFEMNYSRLAGNWYILISAILGIAGLGIGTWSFLRRVEP